MDCFAIRQISKLDMVPLNESEMIIHLFMGLFVDYIDGCAIHIGLDIFYSNIHDALAGLLGTPGHMGCNYAVWRSEKRIVCLDRLGVYHIQTGGGQFSCLQSIGNILLIDELTARIIDKNGAVLHFGEACLINHLFVLRC